MEFLYELYQNLLSVASLNVPYFQFNFGEISLQEPSVGILVIKNTGLTPTRFAFAASHQEKKEILVDSWLTVTPKSSFLDIGADVEVRVVRRFMRNLSIGNS